LNVQDGSVKPNIETVSKGILTLLIDEQKNVKVRYARGEGA